MLEVRRGMGVAAYGRMGRDRKGQELERGSRARLERKGIASGEREV